MSLPPSTQKFAARLEMRIADLMVEINTIDIFSTSAEETAAITEAIDRALPVARYGRKGEARGKELRRLLLLIVGDATKKGVEI